MGGVDNANDVAIGAHVPISAGLAPRRSTPVGMSGRLSAAEYAQKVGATAVQIFVGNPRGWSSVAGNAAADEAFAEWAADRGIPTFIHAPMLVNLGSPRPEIVAKSVTTLRHAVFRGTRLGVSGIVFHAGSSITPQYREQALAQLASALLPVLEEGGPSLLVEPTAGGGCPLAARLEDLEPYFDAVDHHPNLGVCLDTCHVMAAGHDVSSAAGMAKALRDVERYAGAGRLRLVHANDSKDRCGSHRDRHESIGAGTIGLEPFSQLFTYSSEPVPVVVETVSGAAGEGHARDISALRDMAARARKHLPSCDNPHRTRHPLARSRAMVDS